MHLLRPQTERPSMLANVRSVIDIAIVSIIIYKILSLMVGTRAVQLLKGVLFLIFFSLMSSLLGFRLLTWLVGQSLFALSVAVPIVFQPELRKMLEEIGSGRNVSP